MEKTDEEPTEIESLSKCFNLIHRGGAGNVTSNVLVAAAASTTTSFVAAATDATHILVADLGDTDVEAGKNYYDGFYAVTAAALGGTATSPTATNATLINDVVQILTIRAKCQTISPNSIDMRRNQMRTKVVFSG